MGNMMDDAVGLLVGPEMVRRGNEDEVAGSTTAATVAAAAAAAAGTSIARGGLKGSQTAHGGAVTTAVAASGAATSDNQAASMRADEVRWCLAWCQEDPCLFRDPEVVFHATRLTLALCARLLPAPIRRDDLK